MSSFIPRLLVSRRSLFALLPLSMIGGSASAQEKPKMGGTLVAAIGGEPSTLNLDITTDFYPYVVGGPIYSKLATLGPDSQPVPDLARSWEISADGKVYTFHLNNGVKWHDGRPFTSDDVKFTFEKIIAVYHGSGQTIFKRVSSIETPDASTVVVTLSEPYAAFFTFIARDGRIMAKHIYEKGAILENPANIKPIGTGPFRFVAWNRGSDITLERNPDYFVTGQPYLDKIVFKIIPDASARLVALEAGEIDYIPAYDLENAAIERLQKSKDITVTSKGHESWAAITELMFNMDKAPYNDVRVRRALSQAIDRKFIVDKAGFGLNKVATGPISSEMAWAYTPDVRIYPYDPKAAEQLLDEAGVKRGPDGVRFHTKVVALRGADIFARTAEIVANQFKAVGVDVQVSILDRATALPQVYTTREFDMFIHSLTTGPDPAIGVERQYAAYNVRPSPFTNAAGYRNPQVDKLLADAGVATSRDQRAALYKDFQKIVVDDAPLVWLYEDKTFSAYRNEFGGMHDWGPDSNYDLGRAWWKKGKAAP
jgi:peptide/nickel transport system substrate-binding protein